MTVEQDSSAARPDRRQSVLVLDSGIGGISVVRAIRELSRDIAVSYISDNGLFPYGGREAGELTQRLKALVGQSLDHLDIDAVVIACNTASTVVLDDLRKAFPVPFVGVVPPIKTAGAISRTRVIGLLATEGTVRGAYVDDLIEEFAADCRVAKVACPELVDLAEDKARVRPVDRQRLRAALAPLMAAEFAELDVVVLGCTHFPILKAELEQEYRSDVLWLDPAFPVARQLVRVLREATQRGDRMPVGTASDVVFFTAEGRLPDDLRPFLAEVGFDRLEHWPPGETGRAASG